MQTQPITDIRGALETQRKHIDDILPVGLDLPGNWLRMSRLIDLCASQPAQSAPEIIAFCKDFNFSPEVLHISRLLAVQLLMDDQTQLKQAGAEVVDFLQPYYPQARLDLAQAKVNGDGMPKDFEGAREIAEQLLLEAPTAATAAARFLLGDLHVGRFIECADQHHGMRLYERAAQEGYVEAHFTLGCYYHGRLPTKRLRDVDLCTAAIYYRNAAEKGHLQASTNLGILEATFSFPDAIPRQGILRLKNSVARGDEKAAEALKQLESVTKRASVAPGEGNCINT
jgi:TPR repeat protein